MIGHRGFWDSPLGSITGSANDAFVKDFTRVPNNTMALAKISDVTMPEFGSSQVIEIVWILQDTEYSGALVRQKLKCWDMDERARFRALNMLKYLYDLFGVEPLQWDPTVQDLMTFVGRRAGIRVLETKPNKDGKQYNWVSEVHNARDFKSASGKYLETVVKTHVNGQYNTVDMDADIPF